MKTIDKNELISSYDDMIYIGEFTDVIGKFYDKNLVIGNPNRKSFVSVYTKFSNEDLKKIVEFKDHLKRWGIETSYIRHCGQSMIETTYYLDHMTIEKYTQALERIYAVMFIFNYDA